MGSGSSIGFCGLANRCQCKSNEGKVVMADLQVFIAPHQARVNITWQGQNGDLQDPVPFDSTDGDVKAWVSEGVRSGSVPGVGTDQNVDLRDFVVERFASNEARPYNLIQVRPKTPFG